MSIPNEIVVVTPALLAHDQESGEASLLRPPANIGEAFRAYLELELRNGSASAETKRSYLKEIRIWLEWCRAQGFEPEAAKRVHITVYRAWLQNKGATQATVSQKMVALRCFYSALVFYGFTASNPTLDVRTCVNREAPEVTMTTYSEAELDRLFAVIDGTDIARLRDRAIMALIPIHGLSRGELCRLNHDDLHEEGESPYLIVRGVKFRRINLRQDTYDLLKRYFEAKARLHYPLRDAIFVSHGRNWRGQRLTVRTYDRIVDHYLRLAGLKRDGAGTQALRNTHGVLAVEGGAHIEDIKAEMGYKNLDRPAAFVRRVARLRNNPAELIRLRV